MSDDYNQKLYIEQTEKHKALVESLHKAGDHKWAMLVEAMPLSDPRMYDIRDVRAATKKRLKLYSYYPHEIYIKSMKHRQYHRIFENSFSERRTRLDECGSISLTSKRRNR